MRFSNKKGQITLFILIALAVFLVLVVGYILYNEFFLDSSDAEFIKATTPQTELQSYVQQCISIQTRDAIERLGSQGGYVTVPERIKQNFQLSISPHPSRDYVIPYWVNKDKLLVPTIENMEAELGTFISQTLGTCLGDFAIIGETTDIEKMTNPKARVSINKNDVVVDVSFTLTKTAGGLSQSFERFIYKEEVELRAILESAREFAVSVSESTFMEDMTINLMAISDPDIPLSNIQFRCDKLVWLESKVQEELEDVLYYNVPSIRVKGAELSPFEQPEAVYEKLDRLTVDDFTNGLPYDPSEIPSDTYEHAHMYYDGGQAKELFNSGVRIGARYLPEYGMDFAVRPATNGKLYGSTGKGSGKFLKFLCMQVYHFTYDISYPIEYVFRADDAFQDGSPFILRFATSVDINHNLPDTQPLRQSNPVQIGDYQSGEEQLCAQTYDQSTTIIANDINSALEIADVEVNYLCYKFVCPLGNTTIENGRALLRANLPSACTGAKLQFVKDGYLEKELSVLDGFETQLQTYQADLTGLQDIPYKVVLGQNQDSIIPVELKDTQHAVILLEDEFSSYDTYATFDDQSRHILTVPRYGSLYNMTLLVYEDDVLIGGYIGQLSIDPPNLRQELTLHAHEFIPRLDIGETWLYLAENEVYKTYYEPSWR